MTERDPEYDRFGPWILEISDEDPPPPLFLPYLTRTDRALLNIKIPRKIERRLASPGMNLYDYMVSLYEEDLLILQRVQNDVRSRTFFYRDVQYMNLSENLLRGNLHLGIPGSSYDLPFNTVSGEIMGRLVDLIRERYAPRDAHTALNEAFDIQEGELSYYFDGLLTRKKEKNPNNQVLASQSDATVGSSETSTIRRMVFGIISKLLLESLHLSDGRELEIISRSQKYKYSWQTVYGKDTCYMPLSNISAVSWEEDAQNTAVLNLNLKTSGGTVSYAFVRDNPSIRPYAHFLSSLTGSATETTRVTANLIG